MSRVRISTTVDEATRRAAEIDASYAAYERLPLSTPDEWGDLESFIGSLERVPSATDGLQHPRGSVATIEP